MSACSVVLNMTNPSSELNKYPRQSVQAMTQEALMFEKNHVKYAHPPTTGSGAIWRTEARLFRKSRASLGLSVPLLNDRQAVLFRPALSLLSPVLYRSANWPEIE